MLRNLKPILNKIKNQENLSSQEAYNLQACILQGEVADEQILQIFENIDQRKAKNYNNSLKLTEQEFKGFVKASQEKTLKIPTSLKTLDIVGTGGDRLNTFNISTATALLSAKMGIKVAKHGNRSASSISGSADVLESLGYDLEQEPDNILLDLETKNFAFLYAKKYNPAFRFVAPARQKFGKKTYFNFLGPLLNPILPSYMLLGVSDWSMSDFMGQELIASGVEKLWVVSSVSGMDEIAITENTLVKQFEKNQPTKEFEINPEELGFEQTNLTELQIQTREQAKEILTKVLEFKATKAQNQAVEINLCAVLVITNQAKNMEQARKMVYPNSS